MIKNSIILINSLLFLLLLYFLPMDAPTVKGLSLLIFIAVLWLTEAIHVTVTALLVPVLAALLGIFSLADALASFGDPIIFLFLGGFALAAALRRQGLDDAIAMMILRRANGHLGRALLLIFAISAGLSMWISNTATAAMMLPLVLGLLHQLPKEGERNTWVFALLGVAYSASIGGIATLVGSPPNAIAAAATGMSFMDWMSKALPLMLLLLPAAIFILYLLLKPQLNQSIQMVQAKVEWSREKKITLFIFATTAFFWVFSKPINSALGNIQAFDSLIALVSLIALAVTRVVEWRDVEETTEWGVLFLFGGGLCLSQVLQATGTSLYLGEGLGEWLLTASPFWAILAIVTFVLCLTELASNTASAALLIPVFIAIAPSLGIDPVVIATVIAIAASCAFMLPVATPPNAIVFGTGLVSQQSMMKAGMWLNLVCIVIITCYALLFWY